MGRPEIKPRDWITIGWTECVVAQVYPVGDARGDCEVVFNADKPSNTDAVWVDSKWSFHPASGAGYADRYERLSEFVALVKTRSRG